MAHWKRSLKICFVMAVVLFAGQINRDAKVSAAGNKSSKMVQYSSKYYNLYTDMSKSSIPEIRVRLRVMAELYYKRTKGFGGVIRSKLNFYMFKNAKDYYAAGGTRGSAGVYRGMTRGDERSGELLAIVNTSDAWHVVQHEGFHQFVHMAIRGSIPIWVNEGLAEYFGEALWTGDSLQTGIIPPRRHKRIVKMMKSKTMLSLNKLFGMTSEQWSANLDISNYDLAWSVTHFMVHAENGKYKTMFAQFIGDLARGKNVKTAWRSRFKVHPDVLEKKYKKWWLGLSEEECKLFYKEATVETLTSFLVRSRRLNLKFESADDFFAAARSGKINCDPKKHGDLWLPDSLLTGALASAKEYSWALEGRYPHQKLIMTDQSGVTFTGEYRISGKKVTVSCKVAAPKKEAPKTKAKTKSKS